MHRVHKTMTDALNEHLSSLQVVFESLVGILNVENNRRVLVAEVLRSLVLQFVLDQAEGGICLRGVVHLIR